MPNPEGTTLAGRYAIQRELGAGGMAVVYLAHDTQHDRKVALKVLRPELAAVIGADRFLAEIKTTANLQHPHILALFDSGRLDGSVYYVMPFVEGESLRDRLNREKQLPVDEAVRIAREVAAALDYAHRHGVIHRDIKPENILLHDGQALVADFGIALAASRVSDTRMTETGMSLGTPMYMSPEQAMGERNLDARTDVYALGCVLFEMLAGEPPFTGPTAQSIVAKVLTDEPRQLTGLRRSVPANVEDAVRGALEKLPADRTASAKEFADALASDRTPSRRQPATARRPLVRQPVVMVLGTAVVLLTALAAWQATRPRPPASTSVVRFALQLPTDAQLAIFGLTGPNVAISPDGKTIVFAAESPGRSRLLYRRAIDSAEAHTIPGTEGASQPSFSPDGRSLAYLASGRLMRIALDGSAPRPIAPLSDVAPDYTWTNDGAIIYSHPQRANLVKVPVNGGPVQDVTSADTSRKARHQYPVALRDGEHVLFSFWGDSGTESVRIGVAYLSTRRTVRLDLSGVTPLGMVDEYLIYATTTNDILAAPVDLDAGRVTGDAVTVVSGVTIGTGGIAKAALSANGTLVYLGGARSSQLMLASLAGGTEPILSDPQAYGYPRFSPDGKRIALTIASGPVSDVWIYELDSRTLTRLTSGLSFNERPEWSPDGRRVLFRADRNAPSIWWQPVDRSEPAIPLLTHGVARYYEGVLTPDGKFIVYQEDSAGSNVEYQAVSGDGSSRSIASSAADEVMPRVSPDGHWVAFMTDESGSNEVVVQPFPGPGPRIQVSTGGGTEPVWSRDGKRLFYRGGRKFIAANVVTSPTFAVVSRDVLFDDVFQPGVSPHANYDVSLDGRQLLLLQGVDRQGLIVVHNWADEIRARLRQTPP